MPYKVKIGMEIHVHPKTESKMFCRCKNEFQPNKPNQNICEICTGQPGTMPAVNEKAIALIIKAGIGLNCSINRKVHWDRKHYFYPDLPKGYQITQHYTPLCINGFLNIEYQKNKVVKNKKILINRLHLEEDAGKDLHPKGADYSLVDFNRAGVPLIELVTEPVIENKEQAVAFCQELQRVFRYLKISDADMEKGQMRCEVNISLGQKDKDGTKVEVKNINSFKGVARSIDFEIKRQKDLLNRGQKVLQETRGWDANKQKTVSQRSKEKAKDYRYFPEPDIPLVNITEEFFQKIKNSLSELPEEKRRRFKKEFSLNDEILGALIINPQLAEYFDQVVSEIKAWIKGDQKVKEKKDLNKIIQLGANYLVTEVSRMVEDSNINFKELKITPENFAELILILYKKEINSSAGQLVLKEMFETGGDPSQIIEKHDLKIENDSSKLQGIINNVLKNNAQAVCDVENGINKALQFLVGKVMAETRGKADPKKVMEIIKTKIKKGLVKP